MKKIKALKDKPVVVEVSSTEDIQIPPIEVFLRSKKTPQRQQVPAEIDQRSRPDPFEELGHNEEKASVKKGRWILYVSGGAGLLALLFFIWKYRTGFGPSWTPGVGDLGEGDSSSSGKIPKPNLNQTIELGELNEKLKKAKDFEIESLIKYIDRHIKGQELILKDEAQYEAGLLDVRNNRDLTKLYQALLPTPLNHDRFVGLILGSLEFGFMAPNATVYVNFREDGLSLGQNLYPIGSEGLVNVIDRFFKAASANGAHIDLRISTSGQAMLVGIFEDIGKKYKFSFKPTSDKE